jgi:hypothetical protein
LLWLILVYQEVLESFAGNFELTCIIIGGDCADVVLDLLQPIHGLVLEDKYEENISDKHNTDGDNCQIDIFLMLEIRWLDTLMLNEQVCLLCTSAELYSI